MSKIKAVTVHAGHNPQGKIACGASDYIDALHRLLKI